MKTQREQWETFVKLSVKRMCAAWGIPNDRRWYGTERDIRGPHKIRVFYDKKTRWRVSINGRVLPVSRYGYSTRPEAVRRARRLAAKLDNYCLFAPERYALAMQGKRAKSATAVQKRA